MKTSTNALAARYCKLRGWPCETVQSWRGRQRHDLFGLGDTLVLDDRRAIIVQNCSYGTLKRHKDIIDSLLIRREIIRAGLVIELWEWRRKKLRRGGTNKGRRWYVRRQLYNFDGWWPLGEWSEALDLYPKKP